MVSTALHTTIIMIHHTSCRLTYSRSVSSGGVLEWPFWTKLIVVAIGFTGGLIFMYIQCKVYLQLWRRLKAFNRIITVQNCPEKALHNSQGRQSGLTNGTHETVAVPVSPALVSAPEAQMDSDMSVEAAVAPTQNPVWLILLPLRALNHTFTHPTTQAGASTVWFRLIVLVLFISAPVITDLGTQWTNIKTFSDQEKLKSWRAAVKLNVQKEERGRPWNEEEVRRWKTKPSAGNVCKDCSHVVYIECFIPVCTFSNCTDTN